MFLLFTKIGIPALSVTEPVKDFDTRRHNWLTNFPTCRTLPTLITSYNSFHYLIQSDGEMTSETADVRISGKDVMELCASEVKKLSTGEVSHTGTSSLTYADMTRRNMNGDKNEIDEMGTLLIK